MTSGRPEPGGARRLAHVPALDGLRGAAVAAVLVYHGGFGWARGGFLGVSTFFTLSGFLITTLLLVDRAGHGRIRIGEFYLRRARRLLPASLLTLLLVLVLGSFVVGPTERQGLGGDVLSTLAQVANWRFVLAGRQYGDLFATPSLLQHAWSLAIEEQFYLLFPPLLFVLVRRRWSLGRIGSVVGGLFAASVAAGVVLTVVGASSDRLYFGTDVRAAEVLAGALLAVAVARTPDLVERHAPLVAGLGAVGLLVTVGAWVAVEQSSRALYVGGLLAYAVASTAVVAACLVPGPVGRMLAARPLQALGRISYGVYLFHWPIFRWLSPQRLGTSRPVAFAIGTAVGVALASLSHVLVESPIREQRWRLRRPRPLVPLPLAGAVVAGIVIVGAAAVPRGGEDLIVDVDTVVDELDQLAARDAPDPGAPTVGVFGDSTATALALGLAEWGSRTGDIDFGPGKTELGCGLLVEGEVRYGSGAGTFEGRCEDKTERYTQASQVLDLAVVLFGPWDVADHKLPGDDTWRHIGDPVIDAALEAEALRLVDILSAQGAVVLWALSPDIRLGTVDGVPPADDFPTSDPERMDALHALAERVRAARPDAVRLVDLAGFMRDRPGGELAPDLRPDGVHLTERSSLYVSSEFLGPEILGIWAEVRGRPGS